MKNIINEIRQRGVLVSDGAWGTFLQEKGLKPGECPESWNLTRPLDVLDIAQSYIKAGADMIETNSFGGSRIKLSAYGLGDKTHEINKAAAEISRKAAGHDCFVLGSIGPTGKLLIMGDITSEELYTTFKEQSIALAEGGADALVIETMSDPEEAVIAIRAARDNTSCEVICTMTFERSVDGSYHSMMGTSPAEAVPLLIEAGASIIGANCGNGTMGMIEITKAIRNVNKDIPILIHSNAGLPIYLDGKTVFPESPFQMANLTSQLIDAGASIIGGCCGTTPEHIRKISEIAHARRK